MRIMAAKARIVRLLYMIGEFIVGQFSLIRGWLECDFDDVEKIRISVGKHWESFDAYGLTEDQATLYKTGWVFPAAPMNYVALIFYGGHVRHDFTDFFKDCFEKISKMDMEVCGAFFFDDDEEEQSRAWILNEGTFEDNQRGITVRPRSIDT